MEKRMVDHVYRAFPDHITRIRALLQKDAAFGEACADYEEVSTWLAAHCRSASGPSKECDQARELMRELADEIFKGIESAGV